MGRFDVIATLFLFFFARLAYGLSGVAFDSSTFPIYMQFIDKSLLETRLLESVWYSHAQPPLLNLLVGAGIKAFGDSAEFFFAATFHLLGFLMAVAVFDLAVRLTHSRSAAYISTALLVISPSFVLYENWLMYTFPSAALVTIASAVLLRYLDTRRTFLAVSFFALLATLLLLRSLFHLTWFIAVVVMLLVALPDKRRQITTTMAAPLTVVLIWYGKNWLYYGVFAASTAFGLGLQNITTLTLAREELLPMVEQGALSPLALVSRYTQTQELFDSQPLRNTGIPVLDEVLKSDGHYNYNYRGMVEVNRALTADAATVVRQFPFNYVVGLLISNRLFFSPSNMNEYFTESNRAAAAPFDRWLSPVLYGVPATPGYMTQPHFGFGDLPSLEVNTSLPLILVWFIVLTGGYALARRWYLTGDRYRRSQAVLLTFMLMTIGYVYATSTALELGENYRYKFLIEPIFLVVAITVATEAVRGLGRALRSLSPSAPAARS